MTQRRPSPCRVHPRWTCDGTPFIAGHCRVWQRAGTIGRASCRRPGRSPCRPEPRLPAGLGLRLACLVGRGQAVPDGHTLAASRPVRRVRGRSCIRWRDLRPQQRWSIDRPAASGCHDRHLCVLNVLDLPRLPAPHQSLDSSASRSQSRYRYGQRPSSCTRLAHHRSASAHDPSPLYRLDNQLSPYPAKRQAAAPSWGLLAAFIDCSCTTTHDRCLVVDHSSSPAESIGRRSAPQHHSMVVQILRSLAQRERSSVHMAQHQAAKRAIFDGLNE
jgi:hypothetical protein